MSMMKKIARAKGRAGSIYLFEKLNNDEIRQKVKEWKVNVISLQIRETHSWRQVCLSEGECVEIIPVDSSCDLQLTLQSINGDSF